MMKKMTEPAVSIQHILETVASLTYEDQVMIHDILERRLIEEERDKWKTLKEQAIEDYRMNRVKIGNVADLMADLDA
jgi:hypothetical protein